MFKYELGEKVKVKGYPEEYRVLKRNRTITECLNGKNKESIVYELGTPLYIITAPEEEIYKLCKITIEGYLGDIIELYVDDLIYSNFDGHIEIKGKLI